MSDNDRACSAGKTSKAAYARCNRLYNWLYNRLYNRLHRVNTHAAGCTTGCIVYTDIFLVVQPVVQPVVQRVASCIRGLTSAAATTNDRHLTKVLIFSARLHEMQRTVLQRPFCPSV